MFMIIAVRLAAGLGLLVLALIAIVTCMLTFYAPPPPSPPPRRSLRRRRAYIN